MELVGGLELNGRISKDHLPGCNLGDMPAIIALVSTTAFFDDMVEESRQVGQQHRTTS